MNQLVKKFLTNMKYLQILFTKYSTHILAIIVCSFTPYLTGQASENQYKIYVVRHSWHAGIMIPAYSIKSDSLPVLADFPDANYIEIGWGDSVFYQADNPKVSTTLKAGVIPSPSILHVTGISEKAADYLEYRDAVRFSLNKNQFNDLIQYIHTEFFYDKASEPVKVTSGLYGDSYFYRARSKYTVFNNCNHWVADGLNQSGIPVKSPGILRVEGLMKRLKKYGILSSERK